MAAFIEKRGVAGQNEHFCMALEELQVHFRGLTRNQGPSSRLQVIGPEIGNFLTVECKLANYCNVYSPRTAVDNFIKIGGDI